MSNFDSLHPAIQHHVVNSLGWPSLRPLQEAAIPELLSGSNAILLAPTAGGKTEAALFPLLSRMLTEDWQGPSLLYICPIKALLNNLHERLEYYTTLVGRTCGLWHGDVGASARSRIIIDRPDILLTTPESLEVMLVSKKVDHHRMFANVQAIVVDEVHAFAGDDRGWHLMYILERLQVIANREIQRVGLSATVGNPDALCNWLAGSSGIQRKVINPPAENTAEPEVKVDWVGSIENAALVISRLHRGEKRLVFCDSRRRVEELAYNLRQRDVKTFVSHSSISLEERTAAEVAFSQGQDCVIVATSTLELGIDVGDLDRVIQIDAPGTVASFLQRIGRTGRRAGSSRNCLFLSTRHESYLMTLGILRLWSKGYVEPIKNPSLPWHIFAQQIMAISLQEKGIGQLSWRSHMPVSPGLIGQTDNQFQQCVDYMVDTGILFSDQGTVGIGERGEKHYGYKNFMDLFAVFTTEPLVKVMHGRQLIGEVDITTFAARDPGAENGSGDNFLILAGNAWKLITMDWNRNIAYVEPSKERGSSRWMSAGIPLSYDLCQSMLSAICSDEPLGYLSSRALEKYEEVRSEFDWLETETTLLVHTGENDVSWWTFAGKSFNASVAHKIQGFASKTSSNNLSVDFLGVHSIEELKAEIERSVLNTESLLEVPLESDFVQKLKFHECLSESVVDEILLQRFDVSVEQEKISEKEIRVIRLR